MKLRLREAICPNIMLLVQLQIIQLQSYHSILKSRTYTTISRSKLSTSRLGTGQDSPVWKGGWMPSGREAEHVWLEAVDLVIPIVITQRKNKNS